MRDEWWASYQPVSYELESRLGTRDEFADMVRAVRRGGCRRDRRCRHQPHDGAGCRRHRLGGNALRALRVPGPVRRRRLPPLRADARTTTSRTTTRASRCRRASSSISPTSTPSSAAVRATIVGVPRGPALARRRRLPHRRGQAHGRGRRRGDRRRAPGGHAHHQRGDPRRRRADPARGVHRRSARSSSSRYARDLGPQVLSGTLNDPELSPIRARARAGRHPPSSSSTTTTPSAARPTSPTATATSTSWRTCSCSPTTTARPSCTPATPSATGMPAPRPTPTDARRRPSRAGRDGIRSGVARGRRPHLRARVDGDRRDAGVAARSPATAPRLPGADEGDAYGFEREGRAVIAVNLGDVESDDRGADEPARRVVLRRRARGPASTAASACPDGGDDHGRRRRRDVHARRRADGRDPPVLAHLTAGAASVSESETAQLNNNLRALPWLPAVQPRRMRRCRLSTERPVHDSSRPSPRRLAAVRVEPRARAR